jgi:4-diphosphocytidyl-2-C-methyl-D-erythritol kinase
MTAVATPLVYNAPAKLNLGLEVLGRRPDGYHDLATIFLTISLFDRLTVSAADQSQFVCLDADISIEENLVFRALSSQRPRTESTPMVVTLQKNIPLAAGLGGASSDAAAALLAARQFWRLPCADEALTARAAALGSDVPFFLRGGCALGRRRGDVLQPLLLPRDTWFVVVAPTLVIPHKTATQYAMLSSRDFSDGSLVERQAERLHAGLALDPSLLLNAFTTPLYKLVPALAELPFAMRGAGAPSIALSGAGPAHYAVVDDQALASHIAAKLRATLGTKARVFVVSSVPARTPEELAGMI